MVVLIMVNPCFIKINKVSYISGIYITKFDNSLNNNIPIKYGFDAVIDGNLIKGIPCKKDTYNDFVTKWEHYQTNKGVRVNG